MLFFVAYSPTFLAKIAPKINPNPQLNKDTNNVENVIIAAAIDVLLHKEVAFSIKFSKVSDKARECPSTSISIICIAKTKS